MKRLLYSFAVVLLAGSSAFSQHFCGTDEIRREMLKNDPTLAKDIATLIRNGQVTKSGDDSTVYIIPVVFHIMHQNGPENISDEQVRDQIEILNRDYSATNDTNNVNPTFKPIVGNAKIIFKLASYDPQGNCTNGIDRIYTHETNIGDIPSKLNQWDRSRYLNVWTVRYAREASVLGYAHFPQDVNGYSYWIDGIVMKHDNVGSIGTAAATPTYFEKTLSHEAGHWLGLPHVWGNGEVETVCGDDGFDDTPITKGYNNWCPSGPAASMICDPTIEENYQNFMDYASCSYMFTKDQTDHMRFTLTQNNGQRSSLVTAATHASTGVDLTTPPVCIPTPYITPSNPITCVGKNVTFNDKSFNGPVTFRQWTFEDGSPATSTVANPVVSFNSPGKKTVTLIVGNDSGSDTLTLTNHVEVQGNWGTYQGPYSNPVETAQQFEIFTFINDGNNYSKFVQANVGKESSKSMKLQVWKDVSSALPATQESRYSQNLGGQVDEVITPSYDLRYTTSVNFSFDYAYATNGQTNEEITEKIEVFYSRDCADTWLPIGTSTQSTITGGALASGGFAGNIDYVPTSVNDWKTFSRPYTVSAAQDNSKVRFKIKFTASDLSSNLYLDNINVTGNGTLGLENDFSNAHDLVIAPNPVIGGNALTIEYTAKNEPVTFTLRNLQGEEISSETRTETNQTVNFDYQIGSNVAAAYYFLEVKSASSVTVKKIAVIK